MADPRPPALRSPLLDGLRSRLHDLARTQGPGRALAQQLADRADRVLARVESTALVLEKVARAELTILEKLEPIVDDLGALVRLQLQDARRRLGVEPPARSSSDAPIIDVSPEPDR